jgi:hypothetical protein
MYPLLRLAGCAALAGLLITGGCALRPGPFTDLGLNWCDWHHSLRQCAAEYERGAELARRWQTAEWHTRVKDRTCRELIDGRLTLAEATRQFMELPGTTEPMWEGIRRQFAGATPEESMSRRVIVWACSLLEQEPARAEALRRRLYAELNER